MNSYLKNNIIFDVQICIRVKKKYLKQLLKNIKKKLFQ